MRKVFPLLAVSVLFSGLTLVLAAEEKTITGEGQCAKCSLKETKTCQNAIVTDEGGKKVTYYLIHNAVSKKFHKNICTGRPRRSRRPARSRRGRQDGPDPHQDRGGRIRRGLPPFPSLRPACGPRPPGGFHPSRCPMPGAAPGRPDPRRQRPRGRVLRPARGPRPGRHRPVRRPRPRRDRPRDPIPPGDYPARPPRAGRRGPARPLALHRGPGEPPRAGRPDRPATAPLGQPRRGPARRPRPDRRGRAPATRRTCLAPRSGSARRASRATGAGWSSRSPRPGARGSARSVRATRRRGGRRITRSGSPGRACRRSSSAVRSGATLAGITRQWVGRPGSEFAYVGSVGPWPVSGSESRRIQALGDTLARAFGLVGLFGVDFVLRDGMPWPVEVNPRYTASVEVLELALGRAAPGRAPSARARSASRPRRATSTRSPGRRRVVGKVILFATRAASLPRLRPRAGLATTIPSRSRGSATSPGRGRSSRRDGRS